MPNPDTRVEENVLGPYYVDDTCTACELCVEHAPNNFKLNDSDSTAFVYKQPDNEDDINNCNTAIGECPTDSIGSDGD